MRSSLVFFCLFFTFQGYLHSFESQYNHADGSRVKRLKVCGERASGTNFLLSLMHENFPSLRATGLTEFGQKHFLWWFGTPPNQTMLERLKYTEDAVNLTNSDDCLFIVIVRDPYDWLRSFSISPWEVHPDLKKKGFFHFISQTWKGQEDKDYWPADGFYRDIDDFNPFTQKPFRNVLELRGVKINNYLTLGKMVKNFCLVRYEDVDEDPEGFVNFIADYFDLEPREEFIPITSNKGRGRGKYVKKKYFPIKDAELEFINNELDWGAEDKIGYEIKSVVN